MRQTLLADSRPVPCLGSASVRAVAATSAGTFGLSLVPGGGKAALALGTVTFGAGSSVSVVRAIPTPAARVPENRAQG